MNTILAEQLLAALVSAPAKIIRRVVTQIEPEDFEDWKHRLIFEAFLESSPADHSAPGSLIQQINRHLLAAGHYQDQDNGLRAAVADLAGIRGHPEQLTMFINEFIEQRFRRAVADHGDSLISHAADSPLEDVDASLRQINELRRIRSRIRNNAQLSLVQKEGGAA